MKTKQAEELAKRILEPFIRHIDEQYMIDLSGSSLEDISVLYARKALTEAYNKGVEDSAVFVEKEGIRDKGKRSEHRERYGCCEVACDDIARELRKLKQGES